MMRRSQWNQIHSFRYKDEIVLQLSVCLCAGLARLDKVHNEVILGCEDGVRVDVLAVSVKDLVGRKGGNTDLEAFVASTEAREATHLCHQPLVALGLDEEVNVGRSHRASV